MDDGQTIIRLDAEDLPRVKAQGGWYQWPRHDSRIWCDIPSGRLSLAGFVYGDDSATLLHINRDKRDVRKANLRVKGKPGRPVKDAVKQTVSAAIDVHEITVLDRVAELLARSRSDLVKEAILEKLKYWEMIL